jgi:flagellar biosynthesis chaperone FliJ
MPRFRFALAPLLDRRARVEEERKQILALAQRAYDDVAAKLGQLGRQLAAGPYADHALLRFLSRAIETQTGLVAQRRAALECARRELMAARRARRVLEKLQERRRRAFDAAESRLEELELDEANARR